MEGVLMFFSAFLGGLFGGFLTAIFGGVVFGLIREAIGNPKQMGAAAVVLISIFGPALVYSIYAIFQNIAVALGATVSLSYFARSIFASKGTDND
jgi:hypothetical protein